MITVRPTNTLPLRLDSWNGCLELVSYQFGQSYISRNRDLVWRNQEKGGAFCERSKIWFPNSMLIRDATGRLVGTPYEVR